ncbi:hypothetical protein F383_38100 [Gossypium arboreum]|uniref:Uncharacterized protein n=1 Tax=Gossypium arboreum TaxID=29729 RepID=A0A0B0NK15_GOSAR|nr:hypothetical protein F383_38100 [Gossypium arboreum]
MFSHCRFFDLLCGLLWNLSLFELTFAMS